MMSEVSLPSAIRKVPFLAPIIESPSLYMLPDDFSFEGLIDIYQRDYTSTVPYIRTGVTASEFMRKVRNGAQIGLLDIETYEGVQFLNF